MPTNRRISKTSRSKTSGAAKANKNTSNTNNNNNSSIAYTPGSFASDSSLSMRTNATVGVVLAPAATASATSSRTTLKPTGAIPKIFQAATTSSTKTNTMEKIDKTVVAKHDVSKDTQTSSLSPIKDDYLQVENDGYPNDKLLPFKTTSRTTVSKNPCDSSSSSSSSSSPLNCDDHQRQQHFSKKQQIVSKLYTSGGTCNENKNCKQEQRIQDLAKFLAEKEIATTQTVENNPHYLVAENIAAGKGLTVESLLQSQLSQDLIRQLEHILRINLSSRSSQKQDSSATLKKSVAIQIAYTHLLQAFEQFESLISKRALLSKSEDQTTSTPALCNHSKSHISVNKTEQTNHIKMVNEKKVNGTDRDVIVNSTSLEDVALSEVSDRAQSIQSLHSVQDLDTPVPDNTPSYEDLQQRLEASNRNILNMQNQQQRLLTLQRAAKQQLDDMERLREKNENLSFNPQAKSQQQQNGSESTPNYESVDQVRSDMQTLVSRMKNLTSFIQNQNELGYLLGEDDDDVVAEQKALQQKLTNLRTQRDEMRHLIEELEDAGRENRGFSRESSVKTDASQETISAREFSQLEPTEVRPTGEYLRVVPIAMVDKNQNPVTEQNAHLQVTAANSLEQQKDQNAEAIKKQLFNLKEMLETVNMIEAQTSQISHNPEELLQAKHRLTSANGPIYCEQKSENVEDMLRKVHYLNDLKSELNSQSANLNANRDKIKALKEDIIRRKEQAAAAVQMGEDALKRSSLTPTPTPHNRQERDDEDMLEEREHLKNEYEMKKKEFEALCQLLRNEDQENKQYSSTEKAAIQSHNIDYQSEANNRLDDDSDYALSNATRYRPIEVPPKSTNARARSRVESDLTSAATTTSAAAPTSEINSSMDNTSLKSDSSHSYTIPPPMSTMGPITWQIPANQAFGPQAWNAWNRQLFCGGREMPQAPFPMNFAPFPNFPVTATATMPPTSTTVPANSSECICTVSQSNLGSTTAASGMPPTAAAPGISSGTTIPPIIDPVLFQQYVQTQQILINSICQCNQMLWHQQREIDSLNQTIHMVQERLQSLVAASGTLPNTSEYAFNLRAESVPPQTLTTSVLNKHLQANLNRAQSEQPNPALFNNFATSSVGASSIQQQHQNRSCVSNFCHQSRQDFQQQQQQYQFNQQQHNLFQQRNIATSSVNPIDGSGNCNNNLNATGYNYCSETQKQQQSENSTSAFIYPTLNNVTAQPTAQSATPHHSFNNENSEPPSPMAAPGPIFMHHHNNAIHQNNANLRTQNHYANNLHHQHQQHSHSNLAANSNVSTLNNQVPPGNRANNYWDNFRSYSRQNLLSTNSNKSNQDQQTNRLMQHLQQRQTSQHQQVEIEEYNPDAPGISNYSQHYQNLHLSQRLRLPYQQRQQQDYEESENNNINYNHSNSQNDKNAASGRTFAHSLRNNQNHLQEYPNSGNRLYSNYRDNQFRNHDFDGHESSWLYNGDGTSNSYVAGDGNVGNAVDNEIITICAPTLSSQLRNMDMNVNFGNSPRYQRNKVLVKPSCRSSTSDTAILPNRSNRTQSTSARSYEFPVPQQAHLQPVRKCDDYIEDEEDQRNEQVNLPVNLTQNRKRTIDSVASIMHGNTNDCYYRDNDKEPSTGVEDDSTLPNENCADHNDDNNEGDDSNDNDEPTSNEMKRNLLANALKSDKFRSSFFESIKEDVFRRLQSALTDTPLEEFDPNNHLKNFNAKNTPKRDSREYCNQKQYSKNIPNPLSNQEQEQSYSATLPENLSNNIGNDDKSKMKDIHKIILATNNDFTKGAVTSVGNENSEKNIETSSGSVNDLQSENEISTSNENILETEDSKNVNGSNNVDSDGPTGSAKIEESINNLSDDTESPVKPSKYSIINYIITRLREQTHTNTTVNDSFLVEISKLTSTVLQNDALQNPTAAIPHISPKKIYAKIKKKQIPRNRNKFLCWYQDHLESLFAAEEKNVPNIELRKKQQEKNNILEQSKNKCVNVHTKEPEKMNNNDSISDQGATILHECNNSSSSNIKDLTEVDQNISTNGAVNSQFPTGSTTASTGPNSDEDENDENTIEAEENQITSTNDEEKIKNDIEEHEIKTDYLDYASEDGARSLPLAPTQPKKPKSKNNKSSKASGKKK